MQREIKFRAWEKNRKEMLEVLGVFFDVQTIQHKNLKIKGNTNPFNEGYPNTNFCDIELMQYTGLKDKNGIEIYEGDIVCVSWIEGGSHIHRNVTRQIEFHKTGYGNVFENTNGYYKTEVIGNIYENPELLESKVCKE